MKIGDFEIKVLTVENMPENEARFMQPVGVEIKDGQLVCYYKEVGRIVNIGKPAEKE